MIGPDPKLPAFNKGCENIRFVSLTFMDLPDDDDALPMFPQFFFYLQGFIVLWCQK